MYAFPPRLTVWVVSGGWEKWDGPEKSLSISLQSVQLFAVWVPPFPSELNLWGPLRARAPCEEEEDSSTTPAAGLRPACRVACTVLHIINLQGKKTLNSVSKETFWPLFKVKLFSAHAHCNCIHYKMIPHIVSIDSSPAPIAKHEEKDTENDASDSNMDADDDACGGAFILFIFYTVARGI